MIHSVLYFILKFKKMTDGECFKWTAVREAEQP